MVAFEAVLKPWDGIIRWNSNTLTLLVTEVKWDDWKERQRSKLKELEDEEAAILEGRRNLVRQTKELKALSEEEQAQRRPELFKLYQQEIDRLAGAIKRVRSDFRMDVLELCQLPNPVPVLLEGLEQSNVSNEVVALQGENSKLRDALNKAGLDLAELTGKVRSKDASLQSGEGQIKHLMAQVVGLRQELEQKSISVDELLVALAEQEKAAMVATNRLQEACKRSDESSIETSRLKKANEELQRDLQDQLKKQNREEHVQWAEFDVLNLNLRAARAQIVELQRENESLRADLAALQNEDSESLTASVNQRLGEELAKVRAEIQRVTEKHMHQLNEKERRLAELQKKVDENVNLGKSLEELRFLKAAEFPDQYNAELDQSLEALLRTQLKKLESELVHAGNQNRELTERVNDLRSDLAAKSARVAELEKTIESYEASAASISLSTDAISPKSVNTISTQNTDSVITILTNQRDRLKKQKEDLEDKYTDIHQRLEGQKIEINRLRSDNAKLFEKVRLVSGTTKGRLDGGFVIDNELGEIPDQAQASYGAKLGSFQLLLQNVLL